MSNRLCFQRSLSDERLILGDPCLNYLLSFISEAQIDVRKSEIDCQQFSEQKLCGPFVVLIAHSYLEYRLIIFTLQEENVINLRFPVLSSDRNGK